MPAAESDLSFILKKDMLADYDEITTRLADSGVNLVFTGHTHMQNIAVKRTERATFSMT